jgi:starch synthase
MRKFTKKYPFNFWSSPGEFFYDGPLINVGSDFCLMPSLFEPGGIVQHEYFLGSTPVIAYKTGGLKDTVFEFDWKTNKGNGCNFDVYTSHELKMAIERAIKLCNNPVKYAIARKNASESVIDVAEVSRAWNNEFYRIHNKIFIDPDLLSEHKEMIENDWDKQKLEYDDLQINLSLTKS